MKNRSLRFVIIPKCAHPWADEVHKGALMQAGLLAGQLGIDVVVDYQTPSLAGVTEQNAMLESAAISRPDGIAVDPVEALDNMPAIRRIRQQGIPIILFDSPSPEPGLTSVGNDFAQQGAIAAERLVGLIDGRGKVAVMRGFPSAPNHRERYEAQVAVLGKHPRISIVDDAANCTPLRVRSRSKRSGWLEPDESFDGQAWPVEFERLVTETQQWVTATVAQ